MERIDVFFFKQKTAYEMRISDWSSDVCSSDLLAMWRAQPHLDEHQISFLPAINEDLGATMVMGTQQAGVREDRQVDGVFAMWYGKGPGVDRAGDAIHHGQERKSVV